MREIGDGAFHCHKTIKSFFGPISVYSLTDPSSSFKPIIKKISDKEVVVISLKKIYCQIENPNMINICDTTFSLELIDNSTLIIPSGTRWEYKHHPVFSKFKKIEIKQ